MSLYMGMAIVCVYYSILYNTIPYHTMPCPMVHGPWSTHPTQYIFPLNSCSRWITRYLPIHFTHSHTHREILLCSSSPTPLQHTHNTHTQYLLFFFPAIFFPFFLWVFLLSFGPTHSSLLLSPLRILVSFVSLLPFPVTLLLLISSILIPPPPPISSLTCSSLAPLLFRRTLQFRPTQPPTHFVRSLLRKKLVLCCHHGPSFLMDQLEVWVCG